TAGRGRRARPAGRATTVPRGGAASRRRGDPRWVGRGRTRVRPSPSRLVPGVKESVDERVEQRLPRRLDDVLADADGGPRGLAVGRVEQHAGDRARAGTGVEDPDLEVDEVEVGELGEARTDGSPERS